MRRYHHLRVRPERMAFRQRLGVGNVEHSRCKAAAVERLDECGLVKLRAAANMQQSRSHRQEREEPCVQNATGLLRQRQETDQNIRLHQKAGKLIFAVGGLVNLVGMLLIIAGIVLHIVATSRRRRVDRDLPPPQLMR